METWRLGPSPVLCVPAHARRDGVGGLGRQLRVGGDRDREAPAHDYALMYPLAIGDAIDPQASVCTIEQYSSAKTGNWPLILAASAKCGLNRSRWYRATFSSML